VLMILLAGFGTANILFWNRPLLLSLGRADVPLRVGFWGMVIKVALAFVILPGAGYMAEAWLMSGYFVFTVGLIIVLGFRTLRKVEAASPQPSE